MNYRWLARPLTVACGCFSILLALAQIATAQYTTSFGVTNGFLEPSGWTVGDTDSTYQEWDVKTALTGDAPDDPRAGVTTVSPGSPTHSAKPPFFNPAMGVDGGSFVTSTNNFYAFGPPSSQPDATFGATADIFNHGSGDPGEGTYVIVQTGSTLSGGVGNFQDTMQLLDLVTGDPITGGDNASATITQTNLIEDVPTFMGPVDYEELQYEFFLPGYFGDFRVDWQQEYSAAIDTLRVDTFIGPAPTSTAVPEPGSATALLIAAATAGIAYAIVRRRKPRIVPRRA